MDDQSQNASPDKPRLSELQKEAIEAALDCNWTEAVELNQQIQLQEPQNIACLNRLSKALFELSRFSESKKICNQVIELDPYNPIAQKNLKRLANAKDGTPMNGHSQKQRVSPASFLQEPGVTKLVSLVKVAEPHRLSQVFAGVEVKLNPKTRLISVTDLSDNYLGVLPDDISHLLLRHIEGGYKYIGVIKSVKSNALTILVRETERSKKFHNRPTFLEEATGLTISSDIGVLAEDAVVDETFEAGVEEV